MDRFNLEDKITETYNFVDRLNDISYGILELGMTNDEAANAIDGLAILLKIHTEKLFDTFVKLHKLDYHNTIHNDIVKDFIIE